MMSSQARQMAGGDRRQMLEQAEFWVGGAVVMRELKKGWSKFGVDDPWLVVHPLKKPWLPRYHSEPTRNASLAAC